MSDLFGYLADELGSAEESLLDAAMALTGTVSSSSLSSSSGSSHRHHPLLRRSPLYYKRREEGKPVGLDNQGATCYLNSLLQTLFFTPEFRSVLYSLSEDELGLDAYTAALEAEQRKKEEDAKLTPEERAARKKAEEEALVEVSEESVAELTAMGMDRTHVIRTLRKFPSPMQREQALDYLFSHDFSADPPDPVSSSPSPPATRPYKRIPLEFRRFFAHVELGTQQTIGTERITRSFGWDEAAGQAAVQHDIQELYIRLMEALNGSMKGTSGDGSMERLFCGRVITRTTCSICGHVSSRSEQVYNVHLAVKGMRHMRHSLAELVRAEKLEGKNQYYCSSCQHKVDAWRQETLGSLPPLLTFALNRHEYNKKNWQRVKINDKLPFPIAIDMAPYEDKHARLDLDTLQQGKLWPDSCANDLPPCANSKSEDGNVSAEEKSELDIAIANSLNPDQQVGASSSNSNGKGGGKGGRKKGKGGKGGKNNAPDRDDEPVSTTLDPSIYDSSSNTIYDLYSVVVHSGGAHGGHYFAYIRDVLAEQEYFHRHPETWAQYESFIRQPPAASDKKQCHPPSFWYELNDSHVTPISMSKIASQYGGRRTCAYLLFYRRRTPLDQHQHHHLSSPIPAPSLPSRLMAELRLFNESLEKQRVEYDRISNEIEIQIHTEEEFDIHENQLVNRGYDPDTVKREEQQAEDAAVEGLGMLALGEDEQKELAAADTKEPSDAPTSPDTIAPVHPDSSSNKQASPRPPIHFIVDRRITLPELYDRISSELMKADVALPCNEEDGRFVMNQLSLKINPPHHVEGYLPLDDPLEAANEQITLSQSQSAASTTANGKPRKRNPNPKTLEQFHFREVQSLLVWNGRTINGKSFHTGTIKDQVLHLRCSRFPSNTSTDSTSSDGMQKTRVDFVLTISPTTTLSQLAGMLSDRCSIPTDSMRLLSMHPASKAVQELDLSVEDAMKRPVKMHGVLNQSRIAIERIDPAAADSPSLAREYFAELQQVVKLSVLNALHAPSSSSTDSPPTAAAVPLNEFEIEVTKSSTIHDLKRLILTHIHPSDPNLTASNIRLRKLTGESRPGPLLLDEKATLKAMELDEDDMRIRIEQGALHNTETHVDVLVTLLTNVESSGESTSSASTSSDGSLALMKLFDRSPLLLDRSLSIFAAKGKILESFGLGSCSPSSFVLYRGHATFDERGKAFTSEFMTLSQVQIEQSEWIWLEEGEMPKTAKITLDILLATPALHRSPCPPASSDSSVPPLSSSSSPSPSPSPSPLIDDNLTLAEWRQLQQPLPPYVPTPALNISPESEAPASSSTSSTATSSSSSISYVFVAPPSSIHLTPLFTVDVSSHDTLLELKQLLHAYPNTPLNAAMGPSFLRVRMLAKWGDVLGRALYRDDLPLKKQQVSSDKRLAVQILPAECGPEKNLSSGSMLLRLCTGVPAPDGGVRVGPSRLEEFMFDGGEYPLYQHLTDALSKRLNIPANEIGIMKWIGNATTKDKKSDDKKEQTQSKDTSVSEQDPKADEQLPSDDASSSSASSSSNSITCWTVLFPNGPDPADIPSHSTSTLSAQPGKRGKQQAQHQQQKGKQGKRQQKKGVASSDSKPPPPSWCLKFGRHGLHEDDILLVVRLSDFCCASLMDLSKLVHEEWKMSVTPPGYRLVEKDRAEEIERRAAAEAKRKQMQSKRKEIELKIEY